MLTARDLEHAYILNKKIKHANGNVYCIALRGHVKVDGEWLPCYTYHQEGCIKYYTRTVDNFKKFTLVDAKLDISNHK